MRLSSNHIQRLHALSLTQKIVVVQLILADVAIALTLRLIGWRRVSKLTLDAGRVRWLTRFPLLHRKLSIAQITPLVELASGLTPRNRCLLRSIMMVWMLRARGEEAELRLGVRKRAGAFEAHAWTTSGGEVLADRPDAVAEFRTLTTMGKN